MTVVEEYLAALPRDLRRVHELRYEQGYSQEKAAEALGVGRQTLRTLEVRLRDGLAVALDAAEATSFSPTRSPSGLECKGESEPL
jgi:DNA-directed RNA polymerase specialized sigma24 family protein